MKTKFVLLLSTLATAALLLIAAFVFLAAFSLTTELTLAAPPDALRPVSDATTVEVAPLGLSSLTLTRHPTSVRADGISTSSITATVQNELDSFSSGSPALSASAVYTVEAESSEVIKIGSWISYNETACSASGNWVIYSGNANDKVSYPFTGTQVTVLYQKQWNTGFMDVLVDGSLRQRVDTYYGGGGKQCQQTVVVSGLPYGPHTVEAVVVGTRNASSSGNYVVVDAFVTSSDCKDAYEPDDSQAEAKTVTPPGTTHHNFHDEGDKDWVRFWGYEGITYTIETRNLATSGIQTVDTKLVFYQLIGSNLVWLGEEDGGGDEPFASKIVRPITTTGWYYVNVGRFTGSWSYWGCDAFYDLRISGPPAYVYLPIILKNYSPTPPTPIPTVTPTATPTGVATATPTATPTPTSGPCYPLVETSITVGNDPRGVAYNDDDNLIYVANYGDNTVSVINGATYSVTKVITGVTGANGVAYDGTHNLVYVTMRDSAQLAVIDATTNTVSETVRVGNGPNGVAYNPTANKIYVANYISNTVTILNGDTRALITTAAVPGQTEPAHIAVNPVTEKAYVTYHGSGKVGVIDGNTNAVSIIDIYSAGPYGITVDTLRNLIYVATMDSHRIVAIGEKDGVPDQYLGWAEFAKDQDPAQPAPMRVIAVNPNLGSTGHLYATTATEDGGFDRFFAIPKGWKDYFERPYAIDVGNNPREGIAVNLSNNQVYVTARGSNRLTILEDGVPPCLWNFDLGFTFTLCRVDIDGDCR